MKKYKHLIKKTQELYGLQPIVKYRHPSRGLDNINLIITTKDRKKYIIKRYTLKDLAYKEIQERINLKILLKKHNFPSRRICKNIKGEYIFKYQGRFNALFAYIESKHPSTCDIKTNVKLAPLIGSLHLITKNINTKCTLQDWTTPDKKVIKSFQSIKQESFWGVGRDEILKKTLYYYNLIKKQSLPKGLIHADLHTSNLLVDKKGKLYIIDFDDMHISELIKDLGFPIRSVIEKYKTWSKSLESAITSIIRGYNKKRKLLKKEKAHLIDIIKRDNLSNTMWTINEWKNGKDKYNNLKMIGMRCLEGYKFMEKYTEEFQKLMKKL